MTPGTVPKLAALALGASALLSAQEPPPKPKPGYATEGRPGFVAIYDAETVPWQRLEVPGMPSGLEARVLSRSEKLGALAVLTYIPIGWREERKGYHNADEEMFLLEGDLTIGDHQGEQKLTKYSYAFIPEGMVHGPVSTRQGAVMIQWFNRTPDFVASVKDKPGARTHAAVRDWNYYRTRWDEGYFPVYRKGPPIPGIRLKLLRKDPDTGEMTWITFGVGGGGARGGSVWEMHPTFEEYYLLERSAEFVVGECLPDGPTPMKYGNRGYWWRPANVGHIGPISYSPAGYSISLVRTGAQLWADYYTDCSYKQQIELTNDGKWVPVK